MDINNCCVSYVGSKTDGASSLACVCARSGRFSEDDFLDEGQCSDMDGFLLCDGSCFSPTGDDNCQAGRCNDGRERRMFAVVAILQ